MVGFPLNLCFAKLNQTKQVAMNFFTVVMNFIALGQTRVKTRCAPRPHAVRLRTHGDERYEGNFIVLSGYGK